LSIPLLADLASYAEAARIGFSVKENVQRLMRFAWFEKRIMEVCLVWHASTPDWEVNQALGLHLGLHANYTGALGSPAPKMEFSPAVTLVN
jgi:hypothetical protein